MSTIPQIIEEIKSLDPKATHLSKMRKAELESVLARLKAEASDPEVEAMQSAEDGQAAAREWFGREIGEPQVYQGAMHEDYVTSEAAYAEFASQIDALVEEEQRMVAKRTGKVAYDNVTAVVLVAGKEVRGKVVDTVLRDGQTIDVRPTLSVGGGRVLLVVAHEGHPTRRTLHRLVDTVFV